MGFDLFQSVRDSVFSFHNDLQLKKILVALFVSNMSSSMSLIQAINELPLNTDGTASLYASYQRNSLYLLEKLRLMMVPYMLLKSYLLMKTVVVFFLNISMKTS